MNQGNTDETGDRGSYRDPDSFVFYDAGRVFRAFSDESWAVLERARETGLLGSFVESGLLVHSEPVPEDGDDYRRLSARLPKWRHFMKHEKLPFISYPYEWCFSMLADAARVHLRIQQQLVRHGLSLKDASAFNVQFKGSHPVFIDVGSVEAPERLDVWMAYSQFCRMFLFPLLLCVHRGIDFKQIFLRDIEGISVDRTIGILGKMRALRPDLFLDVFMQHALGARGKRQARELRSELQGKGGSADIQAMNLERLMRKIGKLQKSYRLSGSWIEYARDNTYVDAARNMKESFVRQFMQEQRPATVLDLGCNTGVYSRLCAQEGACVLAVDSDHDCVERLYRQAAQEKLNILPLVMDLANPSPGLGFMNRERKSFLERASCDAVLALALVHHLLITARLPMPAIRDLMASLTRRHLVVEFVEREDDMFQTLLALRKDLYGEVTLDQFVEVFESRFRVVRKASVPGSRRHLIHFEMRGG